MKTLILTPNRNLCCGMYQLAEELAKELDGEIRTKEDKDYFWDDVGLVTEFEDYKQVVTLMYPMHKFGKIIQQKYNSKWIVYDQKIPPVTKTYFPNFWRRQAMKYINWRNNVTMQGADEYWDVTKREQKINFKKPKKIVYGDFAFYSGRQSDYKNVRRLKQIMRDLDIPLILSKNFTEEQMIYHYTNCRMYVTMSLWEGYGRGVAEAEFFGKPAVAYDVGAHPRLIKKGICVPLDINNIKSEKLYEESALEVWNRWNKQ